MSERDFRFGDSSIDFDSSVTFDSKHQREEVSFSTPNLEALFDAQSRGWSFKKTKEGFLVRAPEQWLVDLTDPYKVAAVGNVISNYAYHLFLSGVINSGNFVNFTNKAIERPEFVGFQYRLLNGPALESEFRIAGSDSRVQELRGLLYSQAANSKAWGGYVEQASVCLDGVRNINFSTVSVYSGAPENYSLFSLLKERYGSLDQLRAAAFDPHFIPGLYDEIPNSDVYVLVPWGGFRHVAGFVNKDNINKIMLWEYHSDDREQQHTSKYLTKNLKGKEVLILDNSYTGGTLTRVAELVTKEGGNPSRLAIFPKSKLSVANSEYVLILDKVIASKDIDLNNDDWLQEVYKNILCYNQSNERP